MSKRADVSFLAAMEKVLMEVMNSPSATPKEKMDAVERGTKLMLIKHKISDTGDEAGSFFNRS